MPDKAPGSENGELTLSVLITREDYLEYAAQLRREQRRGHLPFLTGGGAVLGAGMAAAYCWVHGAEAQQVAVVEEQVVVEEVAVAEPAEAVRVELDVKFDFDKAQVKQESYGDIKALADFMKQYPQTTTVVEGHTDSVGSDAYNQRLSERRAGAVRDVLVNQYGVESGRVQAVGYGESRPVADNATAEGRAINRRVEAEVEARP